MMADMRKVSVTEEDTRDGVGWREQLKEEMW